MKQVVHTLNALLQQLDIADSYAKAENKSRVPSVWEIQNSHLRELAQEALNHLTASARKNPLNMTPIQLRAYIYGENYLETTTPDLLLVALV